MTRVQDTGHEGGADLVVGGWVLVEPVDSPDYAGRSLPDRLVTISDCIQPDLPRPEPWFGDWHQNRVDAEAALRDLGRDDVWLVTVGMVREDAVAFMGECGGDTVPWFVQLSRFEPVDPLATLLGFEVVGAEATLDLHSWHCHGYAEDAWAELGVTVNDLGLIPTHSEGRRVLDWMIALPPAEQPKPVPWTVVALLLTPPEVA